MFEQSRLEESVGVEEQGRPGDDHDPGRETVEAVDEVDGVRHDDHRDHGDERGEVG
jgi:hypothetical protein